MDAGDMKKYEDEYRKLGLELKAQKSNNQDLINQLDDLRAKAAELE